MRQMRWQTDIKDRRKYRGKYMGMAVRLYLVSFGGRSHRATWDWITSYKWAYQKWETKSNKLYSFIPHNDENTRLLAWLNNAFTYSTKVRNYIHRNTMPRTQATPWIGVLSVYATPVTSRIAAWCISSMRDQGLHVVITIAIYNEQSIETYQLILYHCLR